LSRCADQKPKGERCARILLAKDIAIVVVEQHLDLALRVANRAYVLDRGRVALKGSAQDVRNDPKLLQYLAP
jgi:branched-chain amino acid transport system ATP-binding protein